MAISGDLRVSATLGSYPAYHHHQQQQQLRSSCPPSRVDFVHFLGGGASSSVLAEASTKSSRGEFNGHILHCKPKRSSSGLFREYQLSHNSLNQEAENFLLNVVKMNFFERLGLAWKIIFPTPTTVRNSNAKIAKQRLKMILFSDRCAVSEEAKQKIVSNIVNTLSDFVEIESEEKVQLSVSTDADLGTIYSVTVPVRRVKPEYQLDDETGSITNIEYRDDGKESDTVDVTFDFYLPNDQFN